MMFGPFLPFIDIILLITPSISQYRTMVVSFHCKHFFKDTEQYIKESLQFIFLNHLENTSACFQLNKGRHISWYL